MTHVIVCVKKAGTEATGTGLKAYQAVPACEQKPGGRRENSNSHHQKHNTKTFVLYRIITMTNILNIQYDEKPFLLCNTVTGTQCTEPPQAPSEACPPCWDEWQDSSTRLPLPPLQHRTPLRVCVSVPIFHRLSRARLPPSLTQPFEAHEL